MIDLVPARTVLPERLLVLSERIPNIPSVSIGVWVGAGSKHEPPGCAGVSHFIEHMVFKGTERRTAFEIARSLESVGGSLDAFTGRELTCYYVRTLPDHLPLAIDVLADLLCRPLFDPDMLELEKQVVIDEIRSFEDDPDDLAHDLLARAVWEGHPLGNPVMGSTAEVGELRREDLVAYFGDRYRAGGIAVAAAGAVDHEGLVELVRKGFSFPAGGNHQDVTGALEKPRRLTHLTREEGQEYVCLGSRAVSYRHGDRYPLLLLASLMGGGMSSRLFQRVREERGLAYSVYSYLECFAETGLWATCLALKPEWTEQALEVIFDEFRALVREGLHSGELGAVKEQVKGSTLLSLESTSNRMARLARSEFYYGRQMGLEELTTAIDNVTAEDIMRVAGQVLIPEEVSIVLVGPREEGTLTGEII